MKTREATSAEIIKSESSSIRLGWRIRYRHFVREIYNPRAANGVSHRQYSRSKISMIDDHPHVMYLGELIEITGTHYTLDSGHEFVADLRVKSEYLN